MPRIDFYVLPDRRPDGRLLLACRLTEKAFGLGHRLYIHTESPEAARYLDDLLWTFRQNSFVPHALIPMESDGHEFPPVLIGYREDPDVEADVLINLTPEVPAFFERFDRVVEVVNQDSEVLVRSRERFRHYKNRGYSPVSHRL